MITPKKQFFIKGKEEITDSNAPIISDEFIDKQPEGDYVGQTISVQSETKLEEDKGTGEIFIMRTYEFVTDPSLLQEVREGRRQFPSNQDIFNSHAKGIAGLLWGDGLSPAIEVEPRLIFTANRTKYLIMVWAKPSIGQSVIEKTKTLTEITNGSSTDRNTIQRSIPISPTKKKASSRAAKTSK